MRPRGRWRWLVAIALFVLALREHPAASGTLSGAWALTGWVVILIVGFFWVRSCEPFWRIPFRQVLTFLLYGVLVATSLVILMGIVIPGGFRSRDLDRDVFIVSWGPLLEEVLKLLGPILLLALKPSWRKDPWSWTLAGLASGAGFGVSENFGYYLAGVGGENATWAFLMRVGAIMHACETGFIGLMITRCVRDRRNPVAATLAGFVVVLLTHILWNALAISPAWFVDLLLVVPAVLVFRLAVRRTMAAAPAPSTP